MTGAGRVLHQVDLGGRNTRVELGSNLYAELWRRLRSLFPRAERCGLAIDERVAALWPLPSQEVPEEDQRLEVLRYILPAGEAAKTRAVLEDLQDLWIGLRRDEPVVAIGGGAALDVAGFAAATLRRGLPWLAIPTSVVGIADASVGGKTAINHAAGKNLLGAFHPPQLVLADVAFLATLEARERVAGLAEVYKAARLGDTELLATLRQGAPDSPARWLDALGRAVAVKARLVEQDERDVGLRRLLNYGHTVGHALETLLGNTRMRHGEAVAIGMDVAAAVSVERSLLSKQHRLQQAEDLARLGLSTEVPTGLAPSQILALLGVDKKRSAGEAHTLVLPRGRLGAEVHDDVTDEELLRALR